MNKAQKFFRALSLARSLSLDYIERLVTILSDEIENVNNIKGIIEDERFSDGRVCPYCNGNRIVRNGHRKSDNVQRYLCRCCGKSFIANSNSITSGTRKNYKVWKKYIECMLEGFSVRRTAEICGIHRNTAFAWRHKVLDALQVMLKDTVLSGIVEADETYFPISYKGNHKNSKTFTMPRESRHRGHSVKKSGISFEQVCIPCAIDRKGNSIAKIGKLGKVSNDCLEGILGKSIKDNSIVCTDKEQAYRKYARKHNHELIQLNMHETRKGIYNIQHINSYHSLLKSFLYKFKGVSTKYLNNYLIWHSFANCNHTAYKEKLRIMLSTVLAQNITVRNRELSHRENVPIVV